MSQIGFEQACADFGIDFAALKSLVGGASAITPQADIADSVEATSPTTTEYNALLAKLRSAGVLLV